MRKKTSIPILFTLLTLPVAASCGSDDQTYTPITPNVLDFVKTICGAAFKCCTQGEVGWYIGTFLTAENCQDRLSQAVAVEPAASFNANDLIGQQAIGDLAEVSLLVPNLGALDRAVREGRTAIDGGALAGCEKFLKGVQCNQPAPSDTSKTCKPLPEPPDSGPCDPKKIYIGTLQEGDACTSDGRSFECAPGLICVHNGALGQTGQCVREGKEGDYCFDDSTCAEGLYCSMLDGTCRTPQKPGETCEYADHLSTSPDPNTLLVKCRADLECDPVTELCVVRCQAGHSCSTDEDCDGTQSPPLKCISGRCDTPRGEGLPCAVDANCDSSLYCGPDQANGGKLVCRAREADGTPCTPTGIGTSSASRQCAGFCDPTKDACAPQVSPGSPCPTGLDEQCDHGYCSPRGPCSTDSDCSGSTCDTTLFECKQVCIASKPEGAPCTASNECSPLDCVANFCRKLPLASGVACDGNTECESNFCGLDTPRTCKDLPLDSGERCNDDSQCRTLVCFTDSSLNQTCTTGRQEGELCGNSTLPCDPHSFYCDTTLDEPRCTAYLETGMECSRAEQCRSGKCEVHMQRKLCTPAAAPEKAICDGQ